MPVPARTLAFSAVILAGVVFTQFSHAGEASPTETALGVVPVVVAAFAYPLGNRMMMKVCGEALDTHSECLTARYRGPPP